MPADFTHFCWKLALAFKLAGAILASRNSNLHWWKLKWLFLLCFTSNRLCSDKTCLKVEMKGWRGSPHNTRDNNYTREQKLCSASWFSLWQALVSSLLRGKLAKGTNICKGHLLYQRGDRCCVVTLEVIHHCELRPNSGFPGLLLVLTFSCYLILPQTFISLSPQTIWSITQIMWTVITTSHCSASWGVVSFGHLIIKVLRSSVLQHTLSVKINAVSMLSLLLSISLS